MFKHFQSFFHYRTHNLLEKCYSVDSIVFVVEIKLINTHYIQLSMAHGFSFDIIATYLTAENAANMIWFLTFSCEPCVLMGEYLLLCTLFKLTYAPWACAVCPLSIKKKKNSKILTWKRINQRKRTDYLNKAVRQQKHTCFINVHTWI